MDFLDNLENPESAQPEEAIIPKTKGYNLDFLDNLDNPENAQPFGSPSSHKTSSEAQVDAPNGSIPAEDEGVAKVDEFVSQLSAAEAEDMNESKAEELETRLQLSAGKANVEPNDTDAADKVSSEVQPTQLEDFDVANSTSLAEPPKSSSYNLDNLENPESAQPEEAIIPKTKGYNLDFLDNLDNPENAQPFGSPSSHKTSSEAQVTATNESISAERDEVVKVANHELSTEPRQEAAKELQAHVEPNQMQDKLDMDKPPETSSYNLDFLDNLQDPTTANPDASNKKSPSPFDLPALETIRADTPDFEEAERLLIQEEQQISAATRAQQAKSDKPETRALLRQAALLEKDKEIAQKQDLIEARLKELEELKSKRARLDKTKTEMMQVMGQYEKTISELISENERHKVWHEIEKEKLKTGRAQALDDLQLAESAFANVNQKFERLGDVIKDLKRNEDILKFRVKSGEEKYVKSCSKFESLKVNAETKIGQANDELHRLKNSGDGNLSKLQAMLRRAEMKVGNLESTLEQKTTENGELCKIADELISKVGR